jgi:type IV pilus modification protein PilV
MTTPIKNRGARGFSLLEVLIAIVILSVGLLALAVLQLTLIRASNDAKAQTAAMSLAKEKIETLASYQEVGGADAACISPSAGSANTCYRAIDAETAVTISNLGGVDYSRSTTVQRYVYDKDTETFVTIANTATDTAVKTACAECLAGKEFKRVLVTVGWTDSGGTNRDVQVEDAISSIAPADSLAVNATDSFGAPRKAVTIIDNPASEAGVIPVAIGNGTDTAATNPRPVLISQGNSSTQIETRFDIFTYAALNSTSATAQSRVETSVVGCTCTLGTGTQTVFRPTYWDGTKYVEPTVITDGVVSTPKSGNSVTQSNLCTACCRDHQDPDDVEEPLVDPRRSSHDHYLASDLVNAVTGGEDYNEACRLIRVDGIFRVAAEPYNDHFTLLATAGLSSSSPTTTITDAVPASGTGSMTVLYQNFVIAYLKARFVDGTTYNTVTDPTTVTGHSGLQDPATATILSTSSPKYLHSRGLFIDYLSEEAIEAIDAVKAGCLITTCTDAAKQTAILKLLPFTSINLTELGNWSSSNSAKVSVSDLGFKTTVGQVLPVKAETNAANNANEGDQVTATAAIQRSSSGLAVVSKVFDDAELANNSLTDAQLFQIGTGQVGGGSDEQFFVTVTGTDVLAVYTAVQGADLNFTFGSSTTCTEKGLQTNAYNPYTCVPLSGTLSGSSVPIRISNYNRTDSVQVQNYCTKHNTSTNALNSDETDMPIRLVFDIDGADVATDWVDANVIGLLESGEFGTLTLYTEPGAPTMNSPVNDDVPGNFAAGGEYTVINAPISNNTVVRVNFNPVEYLCPTNYSEFISNTGNEGASEPTNSECTNGNPKKPIWATTYGACPGVANGAVLATPKDWP